MARNSTYMYKLNDYKINLSFFLIIWNFISQDCSGKVYSRVGNSINGRMWDVHQKTCPRGTSKGLKYNNVVQ